MKEIKVGFLTPPIEKAGFTPLSNMIDILSLISDDISVISGNGGELISKRASLRHCKNFIHTPGEPLFRILKFFLLQIKYTIYIIKYNKYVQCWVFFLGGEIYVLPMILARLLKKPVFCMLTSSASQMLFHDKYHHFIKYFAQIGFYLTNRIIVYAPRLISEWNLDFYRHKILIAHEHILDFKNFTVTTPLSDRPPFIGYFGRLNEEKGVLNFVQALPAILSDRQDLRVLIGGDGQLKGTIEASLQAKGLTARVDLLGWISHDDLPHYLNQLRLLVIPSSTEGLPNIMLEAMACGIPVLATPVGAIPDVIIDGKTGFIMENNSPGCIAANVIRALSSPDLEQIAERGRCFVEENFTFERTVEDWTKIFQEIE